MANCCDESLRAKLDERIARYISQSERGGPIYFYEMMSAIMTMTTEAATLMKEKLRTLTMQDFTGEGVKRLEMIHDVPIDLPKQIISLLFLHLSAFSQPMKVYILFVD